MCKVLTAAHGEMFSVKAHGDTMCYKDFVSAYDYATLELDPGDPVELLEVHGAAPGRHLERFNTDERDAIEAALNAVTPFKENQHGS